MAQVRTMTYVHDSTIWSDNYDLIQVLHQDQLMEDNLQEYYLVDDLQPHLEMVD